MICLLQYLVEDPPSLVHEESTRNILEEQQCDHLSIVQMDLYQDDHEEMPPDHSQSDSENTWALRRDISKWNNQCTNREPHAEHTEYGLQRMYTRSAATDAIRTSGPLPCTPCRPGVQRIHRPHPGNPIFCRGSRLLPVLLSSYFFSARKRCKANQWFALCASIFTCFHMNVTDPQSWAFRWGFMWHADRKCWIKLY